MVGVKRVHPYLGVAVAALVLMDEAERMPHFMDGNAHVGVCQAEVLRPALFAQHRIVGAAVGKDIDIIGLVGAQNKLDACVLVPFLASREEAVLQRAGEVRRKL